MESISTPPPQRSQGSGRSGPRTRMGCLTCRRRKVRCDQSSAPAESRRRCGNCVRLGLDCQYAPPGAPRNPPRRRNSAANTSNSVAGQTKAVPVSAGTQYMTSLPGNDADRSSLVVLPPPAGTQQPHYLTQQETNSPTDQIQLDRVLGDMSDLAGFPSETDWPPTAFPTGIMSPVSGLYASSLLPWRDFPQASDELMAGNGNSPFTIMSGNNSMNGNGVITNQQHHDLRSSSSIPDIHRQQSTPRSLSSSSSSSSAGIDLALFDVTEHQRRLLLHFSPRANPIPLITPTDSQWKSAYSSLVSMACGCSHLIDAICAVSELNLVASRRKGSVSQAFSYYQSAATKAEAVLTLSIPRVDDRSLMQAFATLLLLMHAEIIAQPLAGRQNWPTTCLRSAYRHLRRHAKRLRLWTGIGSHILSWIQIVDSKVVYAAGMEKETDRPSTDSGIDDLSSPIGASADITPTSQASPAPDRSIHSSDLALPSPRSFPAIGSSTDSPLAEPVSAAEIAYDALYQPAYKFFMRCQGFIPRIIALDRHHRPRGLLDYELEVLQVGQRLREELRDLWLKRPQALGVLSDTNGLQEVMHPRVALKVIKSFRSFVATFHAIFILLHRVAFIHYPATDELKHSIAEILRLAREQIADERTQPGTDTESPESCQSAGERAEERRTHDKGSGAAASESSSRERRQSSKETEDIDQESAGGDDHWEAEESPPAGEGPFPIALWLWPLFMCGTECGIEDRRWVLERMYAMGTDNSERTAVLLTALTKQQDETNKRIDQRTIRRRIFADEFDFVL